MKYLTTCASVLALTLASATTALAQNDASKQSEQPNQAIDLTTWDQAELYQGWRVGELYGMNVYDEQGEKIGDVENVIINADGKIEKLVVEIGGFLDIGDSHIVVTWDQVQPGPEGDSLRIPTVSEDNLSEFSMFDEEEEVTTDYRSWRATELMGDYVKLKEGPPYGIVDDLIVNRNGEIQAVVVSAVAPYRPGYYAYPYYGYGYRYDPGVDVYDLPYDRSEIDNLKPFDYSQLKPRMH